MSANELPTATSDHDWSRHPIYLALSSRLSATETAISSLSAQVSTLQQTVNRHLPSATGISTDGTSTIENGDGDKGESIAALTQQISLLSSSVAQLQRLQSLSRQPSRTDSGLQRDSPGSNLGTPTAPGSGSVRAPPTPLGLGGLSLNSTQNVFNTGPLTAPHPGPGPGPSPFGNGPGPKHGLALPREFQQRPGVSRSASSNMIPPAPSKEGDKTWGPPSRLPNINTMSPGGGWPTPSPMHPNGNGNGNGNGPPTPGGAGGGAGAMMTPSIVGPGAGGGGNGPSAPGAGIVVTKWEHLNLKPELVRSVQKYGIGPPNKIQARVLPFMLKGSDIIAQAPPTQERIISYVIPAIHQAMTSPSTTGPYRGPAIIIVTTTVDQATQAHKLIRNVGGPLGVRAALVTGVAGSSGLSNELAAVQRDAVQVLVGTPAKVLEVMTNRGGLQGGEVKTLILDEVDQLIARNLFENVLNLVKVLPSPRRGGGGGLMTPGGEPGPFSPGASMGNMGMTSPYDAGRDSPFNPASQTPFPGQPSRFGAPGQPLATPGVNGPSHGSSPVIERQTCIFSNTIPTDVINFSQSLQVRDPVRVLVRREGSTNSQESVSSVTPGINLKHTYVYLTITGSARTETSANPDAGPGTIGSGRNTNTTGPMSEEASRAKEYKLETLVKMLDDYPMWQAVIHVGSNATLEAVVMKLASRNWETIYLIPGMPPQQKKAILQQWRAASSTAGSGPRFLVVFDVQIKPPEIPWSPLVINFDLPRSVEGYAHRAAAAVPAKGANNGNMHGVIVSFVQAAGGDVEMLRSTECAYRFKSAEIPSIFHDLFNH